MKKRIIMSLTTLTLALAMSTSVFASALVVSVDGNERVFTEAVTEKDDVLVNAEELSEKTGINYTYNEIQGSLKFSNSKNTLQLYINKDKGLLNGKEVKVKTPPKLNEEGEVLVPLKFVTKTFGVELNIYEEGNLSDFDTHYFSDLKGLGEITATTKVYTYDEALDILNENSFANQKTSITQDEMEDSLNSMKNAQAIMQSWLYTGFININDYTDLVDSVEDMETSLDDLDEQKAMIETSNEVQLMSQLSTLTKAKTDYYLAEKNLEIEEKELEIKKTKNELGMLSDYDLDKAVTNYEKSKKSLNSLGDAVKVAKQDLNKLLRIPVNEDIFIEFYVDVEDREYDIDSLVKEAQESSLSVKQAERALEDAEEEYGTRDMNYEMAELDLEQAKDTVEKNVYSTYNNLNTVIDNYELVKDSREALVKDYELAQIQYDLGYITELDLDKIAVGIANIDASILQLEMSYEILCYQLDHPELF